MKNSFIKTAFKLLAWIVVILIVLIALFFVLPSKTAELSYSYPSVPNVTADLSNYVEQKETKTQNIKEGNRAEIVWADTTKTKTEYALVYLHGFSASHEEGGTVHRQLAARYGMNLYLSRLAFHGLEGIDGMKDLTAENLMASALEAVAIGKSLGEKVILVGTSTGATLGLPIMAHDPVIHAGIFYSANIDLVDNKTDLLAKPFGLNIARAVLGSDYYSFDPPPGADKFWTTKYPIEATVALQTLMNSTMKKETFSMVQQPVLLVSYFKDELHQDDVVSVNAIKECHEQLGSSEGMKKYVELTEVGAHAMCSPLFSDDVESPFAEAKNYLEETLKLVPKTN